MPAAVARDAWRNGQGGQRSTTADCTLVLSIPRCAARFGWPCLIFTPATRSHLSMRQGMSANALRGDLCRAQAMQFSAQRGKWCAIGPGIHARGTAGMPVGCSARGQAQWKAALFAVLYRRYAALTWRLPGAYIASSGWRFHGASTALTAGASTALARRLKVD